MTELGVGAVSELVLEPADLRRCAGRRGRRCLEPGHTRLSNSSWAPRPRRKTDREVEVVTDERPGTPRSTWSVLHLGHDRHGIWLGARRGNPVLQPDGRIERQDHDGVWLIPPRQFWIAAFWFSATTDLTIDICQPPTHVGDTFSFVDLELDLYRNAQGQAGIVVQEDFAALAAAGLVPERELTTASTMADQLLPLIEQRAEPFGEASRSWFLRLP